MKLIDKDALVAEIENLENTYKKCPTRNSYEEGLKEGRLIGYRDALYKINTLEVKEVDLDAEWKRYFEYRGEIATVNVKHLAKHFYELGLKASQPTTSAYGIEEALKENGIDPDSKEADVYREAIYKIYNRLKV